MEHRTLDYQSPVRWNDYGFEVVDPDDTYVPLCCFDGEQIGSIVEIEIIGNIYEEESK
jgi:hypothetical protein